MSSRHRAVATTVAYGLLGTALVATRLVGIGRGYWHDEIVTVRDFVLEGPRAILAGDYIPNNHPLFSLLGWGTVALAGDGEALLRLWSVVPFVVGALVVTAWTHVRVGALAGLLYLFFVTASPLLLDLSRQARGYGLAFLAMSVLVVAALEADVRGRTRELVAFAVAGVVGTLTLPNFVVAYLATAVVLATRPANRTRVLVSVGLSLAVILLWYAPLASELAHGSRQDYGARLSALGAIVAPLQQVLIPGLVASGGDTPVFGIGWIVLCAAALVPMTASTLVRDRRTLLILAAPVAATVAALWLTRTEVVPRFLSFLLVPAFIVLATGAAASLRPRARPPLIRTAATVGVLCVAIVGFAATGPGVLRYPREAWSEAASVIDAQRPRPTAVFAYALEPGDLDYYSELPVVAAGSGAASAACAHPSEVALVVSLWRRPQLTIPCSDRPGARRHRIRQYARGEHIDVWVIPPHAGG